MQLIKKNKALFLTSLIFGLLYATISLVNHYLFRTYALDLGLYTNAIYKYAHFQMADSEMIKSVSEPILGGHFDLYLIIFSPLVYLFGTYTLLIVQVVAVVFGGIGVHQFFKKIKPKHQLIPIFATVYFYTFFGVFGAFSFDYHSVVIAACIIPWFLLAVYSHKKTTSTVLLSLMLMAQENVSIALLFICLALIIEHRKNRSTVLHLLKLFSISLLYFLVVMFVVIPSFSAENTYTGFLYSSLGETPFQAVKTIITHPIDSFVMLFTNHNNSIYGDYIKLELHLIMVFSGLLFLLKKPHFILMLLPIYFQKLFHDNYSMWGIGDHYNIEFAPIMAIGVFIVISEFKKTKLVNGLAIGVLVLSIASTIRTMDSTIHFTDKSRIRFYQAKHYQKDYAVKTVYQQLKMIPKEASVSAQSPFVPHLSLRENIYQFPIIKDAEYIVYSKKEGFYPLNEEEFTNAIQALESSGEWEVISNEEVVILKKK